MAGDLAEAPGPPREVGADGGEDDPGPPPGPEPLISRIMRLINLTD